MPYYLRKYKDQRGKDMEETASSDFGTRLLYQRVALSTLISSASSSSSNSDSLSSSPSPSPSPLPLSSHHQDSPLSPKQSMVQLSFDDEDELCFSTSNLGYNSSSCGYVREGDEDETIVNLDSAADKSNSPNLTFTQEILPTPTSRLVSAQMTSSVKSSHGRYTRRPVTSAASVKPSFLDFDDSSDDEEEDEDEEGSSSSSTHRGASDDCVSSESDSMDHHSHKVSITSTNPSLGQWSRSPGSPFQMLGSAYA